MRLALLPVIAGLSGCGGAQAAVPPPPPPSPAPEPPAAADAGAPEPVAAADAGAEAQASAPPECPEGMIHVKKNFCTKVERTCLKSTYDKPNHLTLCLKFKKAPPKCVGDHVQLDFCIDRYEYPNKKGGHPPVMIDWYTAAGLCAAEGKRLCYEGEWTAACEGPDDTPFPAGYERSSDICNIDNRWIKPDLKKIYSEDPKVRDPELKRLDESVPSGEKPKCVSGYGVYDMTGNFDEWTLADHDRPKEHAVFAALKGGAWGHVRNACRPVTTSHYPTFSYYFVSTRCCKDPASMKPFSPGAGGAAK